MKHKILLTLIILLAGFLRMYKLSANPPSLYWDEASLGYNAYSILTTGHDEHGELLPVARFIAFGDYKPPGYIYVAAVSIAIFGITEFAIRFPSAVSGVLIVLGAYLLSLQFTRDRKAALIASLALSVSPWDLQLSRAAFEAHLATLFNTYGILTLVYSRKVKWVLPIGIILFIASFYTFNANRIIAPLIILLFSILYWKEIRHNITWSIVAVILGIVLIYPSTAYFKTRESRLRFQEVSIFNELDTIKKSNERIERSNVGILSSIIHNRRIYFLREFMIHLTDHFKPEYLFIKGDRNPRLSIQTVGELYLANLPFLLLGLYWLGTQSSRRMYFLAGWLIIAHIPAATARETPHMLRTASVLPLYQIIIGYGAINFWKHVLHLSWKKILTLVYIATLGISIFFYLHNYWVHYPNEYHSEWQYGYKELVQKVKNLSADYDKVIVKSHLGRPYIYFLLYDRVNPLDYVKTRNAKRDWYGFWTVYGYDKYVFDTDMNFPKARVLRVGPAGSLKDGKLIDSILAPDGKVVFEIGE